MPPASKPHVYTHGFEWEAHVMLAHEPVWQKYNTLDFSDLLVFG
jgi:hypothetical protein